MEQDTLTKELLGDRLFVARKEATKADPDLKLTWIAAQINVSVDTLIRYERGITEPSYRQIVHLANLYGKTVDWFAGEEEVAA